MNMNKKEIDELIDELILYCEQDLKLKEALQWLDKTNMFLPEMDIYERVHKVLQIKSADDKAKEWIKNRKLLS